jgi:hypothetical protein
MDEVEALRAELHHYRAEKEKIRDVIGQIGGKDTKRRHMIINTVFLVVVVVLFLFDLFRHLLELEIKFLPTSLLLEVAVLLVSVKIIWMIHRQAKVDHFQFWILNSIEFQLNMISRRMNQLEQALQSVPPPPPPEQEKVERRVHT